jgi:hypothetical protein
LIDETLAPLDGEARRMILRSLASLPVAGDGRPAGAQQKS